MDNLIFKDRFKLKITIKYIKKDMIVWNKLEDYDLSNTYLS